MGIPTGELTGPDLSLGIPATLLEREGKLQGHAHGRPVLLVQRGANVAAIGAHCTHYGVALIDGIVTGDTIRCPLHHACFDLNTGTALRAPAFDALQRWQVERRDGTIVVTAQLEAAPKPARADTTVARIVIVGGGAAGNAAAETLRSEGFTGSIVMLSADADRPCDRPNLSKGTIAGTVPDDFNYLRPASFYSDHGITLRLGTRVAAIDTMRCEVRLDGDERVPYDALLLATGADPIRLTVPGAELPHVRSLRSLADSLSIADRAGNAKTAVVIGASFIGLETAAALRARGIEVHVVALDALPMGRTLGTELGTFFRALHEHHGVTFHLGTTVVAIETQRVLLENGASLRADLVIAGIGVRPSTALAADAGLAVDNGVIVDAFLETSASRVYAAGDIARWPGGVAGAPMRVEHFVVAERQGQTAARNMLGARERFDAVPFFWTEQYDVTLLYAGHAEAVFSTSVSGSLDIASANCRVEYRHGAALVAVATIGRDLESLRAEVAFEQMRD